METKQTEGQKGYPKPRKKVHHGRNITKLRHIYEWTQKELAEALEVRQQKVSDWEDSPTVPDDIIEKIAGVFGVDPAKITDTDLKEAIINIFKNNDIHDGGILCMNGDQFIGSVDAIIKLTDNLILKEQELREKDKIVYEVQLKVKDKENELLLKEMELLKKEMVLSGVTSNQS